MSEAQRTLDGQWALITGAGKRIGACVARTLHAAGANVAIHYRGSKGAALQVANELNGRRAGSAITIGADLLDIAGLPAVVDEVIGQTGRLDILVNNASSFYPTPVGEITEDQWDDLIGTNLKAPLFLSQACVPHLRVAGGTIINIVDIHATRPLRHHTIYGPAKAGLGMLTRTLARDLAPDIRVNGVSPGAILWPADGMTETVKDSIIKQVPLARPGDPEDIAGCILYLVRDAVYVTGQIIAVDGGRSIGW
ncbi:MAG: pteridine reductase [Gammaproteobacteria bacterium]|nr:pteridine reductase [Gammaproteobacteria bacterium]